MTPVSHRHVRSVQDGAAGAVLRWTHDETRCGCRGAVPGSERAGGCAPPVRAAVRRRRPGPRPGAVAAYRNADGGFGHALEPDTRCPGSQPLAIAFALSVLDETDAWDPGLAEGACEWLAGHA